MSIGFAFTAPMAAREPVQQALEELAAAQGYRLWQDERGAQVELCRTGTLQLRYEKGRLEGECTSTPAGPGLHAAAIELLDALARQAGLALAVEDETDYYTHRDFARMRREHFYSWLRMLVRLCAEQLEKDMRNLCICWDMDQYLPREEPGTVVTPVGRYAVQALAERVEREGIEPFAQEFFLWNERERDARFWRNCALAMLWEDCYFAPSARSEEDLQINRAILGALERAAADSRLPFPKEAYRLLCRLDGREPIALEGLPELQSEFPIGYRREAVCYKLGHFRLPLPGRMLYEEGEPGECLWYDGEAEDWHWLRVTLLARREGEAAFSQALFAGMEEPALFSLGDEGACMAAFAGEQEEQGERFYQTVAQAICREQMLLMTASYRRPEGRDWAQALFAGLQASPPREDPARGEAGETSPDGC